MDFLKRHLFFILCGAAALAGIALGVTGMRAMPKVVAEMESAAGIHRSLETLQNQPVNEARLQAERRRIQQVIEDRDKVMERARKLSKYELLVPGSLPYGDTIKRLEFRRTYRDAMRALLGSLTWGTIPSAPEVQVMRDKIRDEEAEGLISPQDITHTLAGVLTEAGLRRDPVARASVQKAQSIYCYATDFGAERPTEKIFPSLWLEPIMTEETADPPFPDEVWRAQLGYWIQKDVVDAIVALNEERAEAARAAGEHPWVGIMPVKEVISIRLAPDFVTSDVGAFYGYPAGGPEAALPPGSPQTVFTGHASGDVYDVYQYSVKLVMDEREIQNFIERLSNNTFHTVLRVAYKAEPPNKAMTGKIYGSGPVVNVVMDIEIILLGEVFRRWMPERVRERDGFVIVQCRDIDECAFEPGR